MAAYDTNLAAEYYVLACLHRRGVAAALTLGNKKGVDVMVARGAGEALTVEVKGVAKKYDWPASNLGTVRDRHYVVLVCFDNRIGDVRMPAPSVWLIPHRDIGPYLRKYKGGRTNVSRAAIMKHGGKYKDAWGLVEKAQ